MEHFFLVGGNHGCKSAEHLFRIYPLRDVGNYFASEKPKDGGVGANLFFFWIGRQARGKCEKAAQGSTVQTQSEKNVK